MKKEIIISEENGSINMKCIGFNPYETLGILKSFENQIINNISDVKIQTTNKNNNLKIEE